MARLLRVEFPGAIYHVTCRMIGNWRKDHSRLFEDDRDRERFVEQLGQCVEMHSIRLYLFVCMTNHLHLVFETPQANCSKFMQSLLTAYSIYYNLRHKRHGHLFDGRFKGKLVEGDDYLLALSRYVHLNPVFVGAMKRKPIEERIDALRSYRWSSYPGYILKRHAFDFVDMAPMLSEMSGRERDWPKRYRTFVESGLAETDDEFMDALKQSPRCIGGERFSAWVDDLYHQRLEQSSCPEDAAFRHTLAPLPPNEVLCTLSKIFDTDGDAFECRSRGSALRAVAALCLIQYAGLTQRQVADTLKIGSGAAVSLQLKSLPDRLQADRRLRRQLKEARRSLSDAKSRANNL